MNTKNRGFSLILLVITIVVLSILTAMIIEQVRDRELIDVSNEASFKANIKNYKTEVQDYMDNKDFEAIGKYDSSLVYADMSTLKVGGKDVEGETIKNIIPDITDKDMIKFIVSGGELKYSGAKASEQKWASELNIEFETAYVQRGLFVHLDGINNSGNGHDKYIRTWKDLSGKGNDFSTSGIDGNTTSGWLDNALSFDGVNDVAYRYMPLSGDNGCIEVVCSDYSGQYMVRSNANSRTYIRGGLTYKGDPAVIVANMTLKPNKKYTVVLQWSKKGDELFADEYINGKAVATEVKFTNNYNGTYISLGSFTPEASQLAKVKIYGLRIYERSLSTSELEHNYYVDKINYGI